MSEDIKRKFENLKVDCNMSEIMTVKNVLERHQEFQISERERQNKLNIESECLKRIFPKFESSFLRCPLCNSLFLPLINSFYECAICHREVCSSCIIFFKSPSEISLCRICHMDRLHRLKSGSWLMEKAGPPMQDPILDLGSKLTAIENEIKQKERINTESNNQTVTYKRLAKLKPPEDRNGHVYKGQNGSARTSIINKSMRSVSSENLTRTTLASNLKTKYQIKGSQAKDSPQLTNGYGSLYDVHDDGSSTSVPDTISIGRSSITSCNSELFCSDLEIQGEVLVTIQFSSKQSHLNIRIYQCRGLTIVNKKENVTNPYIKLYLLPDKSSSGKRKTSVKMNTTNPIYDEVLSFHMSKTSLNERTLNISVWHYQNSKRGIFMGEANIPLLKVDFNNFQQMWVTLCSREKGPNILSLFIYRGEVLIGLRYVRDTFKKYDDSGEQFNSGELTIFIRSGRNLGSSKDMPNPYIKCVMRYKEYPMPERKTKVIKGTTNPVWDTEFHYESIDKAELKDSEVELIVLSREKVTKEMTLGKILFKVPDGNSEKEGCKEKDVLMWKRFINSSSCNVLDEYLPLRTSFD